MQRLDFRAWPGLIAFALMVGTGLQLNAAVIRSPIAAPVNTAGPSSPGLEIERAFDQSGLSAPFVSGVTDFDAYLATAPNHSRFSLNNEWFSSFPLLSGTIVFDLGGEFTIDRLVLWNEETSGVGTLDVATSNDVTFATNTSVGSFAPINNPLNFNYLAEVFDLVTTTARYVRVEMTAATPRVSDNLAIGEIAFSTNIPEPATGLLLTLGFAGLTLRRRKRCYGCQLVKGQKDIFFIDLLE